MKTTTIVLMLASGLAGADPCIVNTWVTPGEMSVAITYDPAKEYQVMVSESLGDPWFPIKRVSPADCDAVTVNGVGTISICLPKPFFTGLEGSRGFVKIAEITPDVPPVLTSLPFTMVNNGDYFTVTWVSEAGHVYDVLASRPDTPGVPVDTYAGGTRVESFEIMSQGASTTVYVCNPMLPWIDKDSGTLTVTDESAGVTKAVQSKAVAQPKRWLTTCVASGSDSDSTAWKYISYYLNGTYGVELDPVGPLLAKRGKYLTLKLRGYAYSSWVGLPLLGQDEYLAVNLPDATLDQLLGPEDQIPVITQTFTLDRFTGDSLPKLIVIPEVKKIDKRSGQLQFHLELNNGAMMGVATYDQQGLLGDALTLGRKGMGFDIKTGGENVNVQLNWAFMPTYNALYQGWLGATGATEPADP